LEAANVLRQEGHVGDSPLPWFSCGDPAWRFWAKHACVTSSTVFLLGASPELGTRAVSHMTPEALVEFGNFSYDILSANRIRNLAQIGIRRVGIVLQEVSRITLPTLVFLKFSPNILWRNTLYTLIRHR